MSTMEIVAAVALGYLLLGAAVVVWKATHR